jgi:steroid delta-isomerase-like uncharacterized protein
MPSEKATFLRQWFEDVWNKGRREVIRERFPEDGLSYGLGEHDVPVSGPGAFEPFYDMIRGAFPNIRITIHDTIEEGDRVVGRWSAVMTHTGPDLGIAPTGKRIQITGITIMRIVDGKIVESWNNWDQAGMMQQINAPPAESAKVRFLRSEK